MTREIDIRDLLRTASVWLCAVLLGWLVFTTTSLSERVAVVERQLAEPPRIDAGLAECLDQIEELQRRLPGREAGG